MESPLETVALFSFKLAYETDGRSPVLRDDLIMSDYQKEVFGLLVRRGDIAAIQHKIGECLELALCAIGGSDTVMGRELQRLSANVQDAQTIEQLDTPLIVLRDYLKDIV